MFRKQSKLVIKELKPGLENRERSKKTPACKLEKTYSQEAEGRKGRIRKVGRKLGSGYRSQQRRELLQEEGGQ